MDSLILMGIDRGKIHYVLINEPVLAQRKLLHEIMNFPAKYKTEHSKLKRRQQNASCMSAGEGERPYAAPDLHRPPPALCKYLRSTWAAAPSCCLV